MLGPNSMHADVCFVEGFVGTDYALHQDLTDELPDEWRVFNNKFIPVLLEHEPEKTRISAGLACGQLWTVSKGIQGQDIVLCPNGAGQYRAGTIIGDYTYAENEILPHRRPVQWLDVSISRSDMSEGLRRTCGSQHTVVVLDNHVEEIEQHLNGRGKEFEIGSSFALEKHLEDFLVTNWDATELAKTFSIYRENGEVVGQQYPTDTGPIDILAISRDSKTILVIELKRGRASDKVVGQTLRYMGFVKDVLAGNEQIVRGLVIALEDDQGLRRALSMVPSIDFKRYEVSFRLLTT